MDHQKSMALRRITEIPCHCPWCGFDAMVTGDCDSTEDGDLFCPNCEEALVNIEYNDYELDPVALTGFVPDGEAKP
jgi:hypothetical protein